jgi:dTDP-4-dehydrorhamnose reductase
MILITGGNGQLGQELRRLAPSVPGQTFLFTDVAELDITDELAIQSIVESNHIDTIINCAAYTAVDKAEEETEAAFRINSTATGNLARVAGKNGARLIHISTDYVFNGTGHRPYREDDPTGPVSQYARSKHAGEEQIIKAGANALIIRTSWLYSEFGHNFVKTIMKYGKERGLLKVVYDQVGTPTYAADLAAAILKIVNSPEPGGGVSIYHYSNEGVASWYDFALAILEFSEIPCKVIPICTHEYPLPAVRPWYSVFDKSRIKHDFGIEIPYWRDSLQTCIKRLTLNP